MKVNEGTREEGKIYVYTTYIYICILYICATDEKGNKRETEKMEKGGGNNMAVWERNQRRLADFSIPAVK